MQCSVTIVFALFPLTLVHSCSTTREHIIYAVDVAPNLATRAGSLLAEMATDTSFYEWELKSTVNKLVQKDVDLLHRRHFDARELSRCYCCCTTVS